MKIAILGCDGTHSEVYAGLILSTNTKDKVVLWDTNMSNSTNIQITVKSATVANELSEALEGSDLAMVVGRYASSHFEPAEAALKAGIPVYIDKPGLQTLGEVEHLMALANRLQLPLRCFSPFVKSIEFGEFSKRWAKGAHFLVASPAFCHTLTDEGANDISFYTSHATDLLVNLCDVGILDVRVTTLSDDLWVDVSFINGIRGVLYLPYNAEEFYKLIAFKGERIDTVSIDPWGSMYQNTLNFLTTDFLTMGWVEGQFESALNSARVVNAIRVQAGEFAWKR